MALLVLTMAAAGLFGAALSADILAVFPHTGKSHFDVYEPLVLSLAARGHRLTVVSFFPQKTPVANLTDISLVGLVPLRLNQVQFDQVENCFVDYISMARMGYEMCEKILTHAPVRELLVSDVKFDLLLVEFFNTDCFLSLSHKYNVPYVAIVSANTSPDMDERVGVPYEPAYVSHPDLPLDFRMSLPEKIFNLAYAAALLPVRAYFRRLERQTVARLVDASVPPLDEIARNVSLLLVNEHSSLLRPRPLTPSYVEVGGIHIHPAKPLQKTIWGEIYDYNPETTTHPKVFIPCT